MENYLQDIVRPLVSFPNEVRIEQTIDERGVLLTLFVNPADMGKIIGREGNTAKAIRHLVRNYGMMTRKFVSIRIYDPQKKAPQNQQPDEFEL